MPNPVQLQDVVEFIADCEHRTAPAVSRDAAYAFSIGTPNIRGGRILLDSARPVDQSTYESWTQRGRPQAEDLILAREAPVGDVGRVNGNQRLCLGQRTVLLRPDQQKVNPRFLHYLLLSPPIQQWMQDRAAGSTVAHLNVEDVYKIDLGATPPLPEQRAIAEVLGALDDKIEANRHIEAAAWAVAQAQFDALTEERCEQVPLGSVIDLAYGKALPARARVTGEIPVFGSGGLVGWHNKELAGGPGVIVGRKGTAGAVHWCHSGFFAIDTTFYVDNPRVPMLYAYFVLRSLGLDHMNSDSAVPGLNRTAALARLIPVPRSNSFDPLNETGLLVVKSAESASRESQVLEALRDALLPKLLSGELRVHNAESLVKEAV